MPSIVPVVHLMHLKWQNISKLDSQINESKSECFISRAQGWIAEEKNAISDIREKIKDLR